MSPSFINYTNLLMIDGYHIDGFIDGERTVILFRKDCDPYGACRALKYSYVYLSSMKNVHEIFERAYGTCEIVEAYPIRPSYNPCLSCSTCATYATSRVSNARISIEFFRNFSGHSSYFAPIKPFSVVSHTSRSFMRVFLTDSCYVGKYALHYPFFDRAKQRITFRNLLITRMWCTEIKLDEYITPNTSCILREMRNTAIREAHEFPNRTFWVP